MPLSLAIPRLSPRMAIDAAASLMAAHRRAHVQLDATLPGLRARDLDRSARRDLVATLKRHGCRFSGIDLFIPPEHFALGEYADRAATAAIGAIDLLSDFSALGAAEGGVVCLRLPASPQCAVILALAERSIERGVTIANFGDASLDRFARGVDCEQAVRESRDVAALIASKSVSAVRLGDWNGSRPVAVGSKGAKLDLSAVAAACSVAAPQIPVIIDTSQAGDDWNQWALQAIQAWDSAIRVGRAREG